MECVNVACDVLHVNCKGDRLESAGGGSGQYDRGFLRMRPLGGRLYLCVERSSLMPMKIDAKRIRMALRSPGHFTYAVRHVLRNSPLGRLDHLSPSGHAFRPNMILINITGRCNLRCNMCMQPRGELGDNDSATISLGNPELTPEQWCDVVDQAVAARPGFFFSGGEPLMYKGIEKIIGRVKQHKLPVGIVTNGTALGSYAERLVELGVDNVTVSIDGPEEVHDAVRKVKGSFQRTLRGIARLEEVKREKGVRYPTVKVNSVILPDNIDMLESTIDAVRQMGVQYMNLQHPIWDSAQNVEKQNDVFPRSMKKLPPLPEHEDLRSKGTGEFYELEMTEEMFEKLEATLKRVLASADGPTLSFFPDVKMSDLRAYYFDIDHAFEQRCTSSWSMMRLLSDGTFEPCMHHIIGNVAERPLWDLWNDPRMRLLRRNLVEHKLYPACARCCYRAY